MGGIKNTIPNVTPAARAFLQSMGFVELCDETGRLHFMERETYGALVTAGKFPPAAARQ
jgi:hypothetical protein